MPCTLWWPLREVAERAWCTLVHVVAVSHRAGGSGGGRLHFPAGLVAAGVKSVSAKMGVDKELLELDLYSLLGVGKKASEKEVRACKELC